MDFRILTERKPYELAPGRRHCVSDAQQLVAVLNIGRDGGTDPEVSVGAPSNHIARVLRVDRNLASGKHDSMHIERPAVPSI